MEIDGCPLGGHRIDVGDAHQHANAAGRALRPLDLVQIARVVVVDGRPGERGEIAQSHGGARIESIQLALDLGREVGFEPAVDHFLARRGG